MPQFAFVNVQVGVRCGVYGVALLVERAPHDMPHHHLHSFGAGFAHSGPCPQPSTGDVVFSRWPVIRMGVSYSCGAHRAGVAGLCACGRRVWGLEGACGFAGIEGTAQGARFGNG